MQFYLLFRPSQTWVISDFGKGPDHISLLQHYCDMKLHIILLFPGFKSCITVMLRHFLK